MPSLECFLASSLLLISGGIVVYLTWFVIVESLDGFVQRRIERIGRSLSYCTVEEMIRIAVERHSKVDHYQRKKDK